MSTIVLAQDESFSTEGKVKDKMKIFTCDIIVVKVDLQQKLCSNIFPTLCTLCNWYRF